MIFEIGMPKTATRSVCHAVALLRWLDGQEYLRSVKHGPHSTNEGYMNVRRLMCGAPPVSIMFTRYYQGALPVAFWQHICHARRNHADKYILTVRPFHSWWKSASKNMRKPSSKRRAMNMCQEKKINFTQAFRLKLFGSVLPDRSWWDRYHQHNERVQEVFGNSPNFLVFNVWEGDGWEKLCPFLGYDVPDIPFPTTRSGNPRRKIQHLIGEIKRHGKTKTATT